MAIKHLKSAAAGPASVARSATESGSSLKALRAWMWRDGLCKQSGEAAGRASARDGHRRLLSSWVMSEGVCKPAADDMVSRSGARASSSLLSNWIVSEGVSKLATSGARTSQAAKAKEPFSLVRMWMWDNGVARLGSRTAARSGSPASTFTTARNWFMRDGVTPLLKSIKFEEVPARQGISKVQLAESWLFSEAMSKFYNVRAAVGFSIAILVAAGSCYAEDIKKAVEARRHATSSAIVRRTSMDRARMALKYI